MSTYYSLVSIVLGAHNVQSADSIMNLACERRRISDCQFRVWKGILGIRDLTKNTVRESENDKYLVGIRDLTAPREAGFAKTWAWDAGFFRLFVGNSGNRHDPNKLPSSQSRWRLLSSQTIECAWLIFIYLKLSESILFQPDATKVYVVQ